MSKELMYILITKMHLRLNALIEKNNYDLLNEEVCNTASGWTKFCPFTTGLSKRTSPMLSA